MKSLLASGPARLATAATVAALLTTAACGPGGGSGGGGAAAEYPSESLEIIVPAAPGGGWDLTARRLQQVMQDAKLTDQDVQVVNREGGGGATGLSELVSNHAGDPHTLMMGGLVMIGALAQADSPLNITDATPIATLTSEAEAFVVRADSEYKTIEEVVEAYKADPKSVTFGGGSQGGSDHIVAGMLLKAAGADPSAMNYIGYSGGGEATAGILSGDVEVGVSGMSEFVGQVESGEMRLLAISQDTEMEVAGKPVPTLADAGYDVDFVNWRALLAPPDISDADREAVTAFITKLHDSEEWAAVLKEQGWSDDFRTGEEAAKFITEEEQGIKSTLADLGL